MNKVAREKLREIVNRGGEEILQNRNRCEGLLRDHCGACRREISALMGALDERVPLELNSSWQSAMTPEAMRARLVERLHENRGLDTDVADWAVEAWSFALGVDLGRISDPIRHTPQEEASNWLSSESLRQAEERTAGPGGPGESRLEAGGEARWDRHESSFTLGGVKEWTSQRKGLTFAGLAVVLLLFAYASGAFQGGPDKTVAQDGGKQQEQALKSSDQLLAAAARAGARVRVRINQSLDSEHASRGQEVSAALAEPLTFKGKEIAPRGAGAVVRVTGVKSAGHFKGLPEIRVELFQITLEGRPIAVRSRAFVAHGKSRGKDTAVKTGAAAAGGGILGGILGKGKGALIGASAGASGALGLQAATKPSPAVIRAETIVSFKLAGPPEVKR